MTKLYEKIRDTFIAGLIFLLPLLVLVVLISKVFQFLAGFTNKIAALFGLDSFGGLSGGTIVSALGIIMVCVLCGYLVRVSFFKRMSSWVDRKMASNIPGYTTYKELAMSKLEPAKQTLNYQSAVWIEINQKQQPGFLLERFADGRMLIFVPQAGNVVQGELYRVRDEQVEICIDTDMQVFLKSIEEKGAGLSVL